MAAASQSLWAQAAATLSNDDQPPIDITQPNTTQTVDDILATAIQKQNECLEKRWKYRKRNGQVVILRDVFAKVVKWVDTFKQIGDTIMQYDLVHAALLWAGVRLILQIAVNDSQIYGAMAEGIELVSNLITRYAIVELLYLQTSSKTIDQLKSAILKLYSAILIYLNKSFRYYEQNSLKRVAKSLINTVESDVEQYLTRIVVAQTDVDACTRLVAAEFQGRTHDDVKQVLQGLADLNMRYEGFATQQKKLESIFHDLDEPIKRTATKLQDLHDALEKSEREKIFQWLSCVPYLRHHRAQSRILLPGSCQWLYGKAAYQEWRQSSVSSILWLHGIPGSGKSMLITSLIEKLRQENIQNPNPPPLAYFYCARNSAELERADPDEIMRSILEQLSSSDASLPIRAPVVTIYKEKEKEAKGRPIEPLTLEETVDVTLEILEDNPATIIIDALDECDPSRRQDLLIALSRLIQNSASLLKVFVSSRDDHDIVHRLANSPNLYINASDNEKDIQDYVRIQVDKAIEEEKLLCGDVSEPLKGHIIHTLTSKAKGMFRLVSLHLEQLCAPDLIKTEENVYYTLDRLPRALNDSYDLILKQISNSQYPNPDLALRALKWLLCARHKLYTIEFIAAISVDLSGKCTYTRKEDVLSICCNLVVHDPEEDTFRFAHLSVREYLEALPEYGVQNINAFALERCLNSSLNLLHLSPACQSIDQYFLHYAHNFWYDHHDKNHNGSEPLQLNDRLRSRLLDFFFYNHDTVPSFSSWILNPNATQFYNGRLIGVLRCLINKDLRPDKDQIERAAKRSELNSAILVNIMLIDMLFDEEGEEGYLELALPVAVRQGRDEIAIMLLRKGANVNVRDAEGMTALSHAIDLKNTKLLSEMLSRGADSSNRDKSGKSDLYRASESGYELGVRLILQHGANVNTRNDDGTTALMAAATHGHSAIVQLLVENNADTNTTGYLHESTLHQVARIAGKENATVARLLLDNGAEVDFLDYRQRTPLHNAAEAGTEALVELLLERGAQISKKTEDGKTPIEIAAVSGSVGVVGLLLEMEEDPDAKLESTRVALLAAADSASIGVVKSLMDLRIDLRKWISPAKLISLAHTAEVEILGNPESGCERELKTLQLLLANWAEIDAPDNTGQTLLHQAAKQGYGIFSQLLLEQQARPDIKDFKGETALLIAASEGHKDVVRHLLDAKADIKAATPVSGYTALHKAAEAGRLDIVKMLMEAGADINAELSDGQTALHLAAAKGHDNIFAYLLDLM